MATELNGKPEDETVKSAQHTHDRAAEPVDELKEVEAGQHELDQESEMADEQTANDQGKAAEPEQQQRGRRVLHFETLSKKDKERLEKQNKGTKRLRQIEKEIQYLIKVKEANNGTFLGTSERKLIADKLGVSVWTIDNYIRAYEKHPSLDAFIGAAPGRRPGQGFTAEQEALICFFYLNPEQKTIFEGDGSIAVVPRRSTVAYIHALITKFCPDPPKSIYQVQRYLKRFKKDDPVVVTLARRGLRYLRDRLMPTSRNDVDAPHKRWQLDGRPLPIYIKHDGLICTVSLLLIMDDYSRYIVRARLIPRMIRDERRMPRRTEFNRDDVGLLVASAMYHCRMRPWDLYTDNGSQIVPIGLLLVDLLEDGECLIKFTRSIPGRPRGRGKIENLLGQFDELLLGLPACAIPDKEAGETEFAAIQRARNDPQMLTLEQLQVRVDWFIKELNKKPRTDREKRPRNEIWESVGALPPPPIRQLMRLLPEWEERDVRIDHWKFIFRGHEQEDDYEPDVQSVEDMYRWLIAGTREEFIPLRAAKLDDGWKVEVCLDRDDEYWCEGILKSKRKLTEDQYNELFATAMKRAVDERAERLLRHAPTIEALGAHRAHKGQITQQPMLPEEIGPSTEQQADTQRPGSAGKPAVSVRSAKPSKPAPAAPRLDWSGFNDIDFDELMRRAQEE